MFTAKIANSKGQVLMLTGNEPVYQIIDITGLNPPTAQVNTATIVGLDGAVFNSSKLDTRNIVITLKINGNAEANRKNLYKFFRTKDKCTFFYKNNEYDVSIDGYVESFECGFFSNAETAQISIICPYPYFIGVDEVNQGFSNVRDAFTFPFAIDYGNPVIISEYITGGIEIYNASDSDTGAIVNIDFHTDANSIRLQNTTTGEWIKLEYSFLSGDRVTINTNKGRKAVNLIRNGVISNIFGALKQGSIFFRIESGSNYFEYLVNDSSSATIVNDVTITFHFHNEYRGV